MGNKIPNFENPFRHAVLEHDIVLQKVHRLNNSNNDALSLELCTFFSLLFAC